MAQALMATPSFDEIVVVHCTPGWTLEMVVSSFVTIQSDGSDKGGVVQIIRHDEKN
jgi:hypothetical protein